VIAETADAAEHCCSRLSGASPESSAQPVHQDTSSSDALAGSGEEIIMPALGMAQDTGLIVAWRKKSG
jgi:hypothetical protein